MKRILFVDDDQNVLQGFKRMLHPLRHEWEMEFVMSGEEALEFMSKSSFDVVVSDMRMPGMDGLELLKRIKKTYPDTAAIVMTGHETVGSAVEAMKTGAYDYIVKPLNNDEFTFIVRKALSEQKLIIDNRKLVEEMKKAKLDLENFAKTLEQKVEERTTQLKAKEVQFRNVIEKNADALLVVDNNNVIRYGNPAVKTVLGYEIEALVGQNFGFPITGDRCEIDIIQKAGKLCLGEMRVVKIEWEQKPAYLISIRDITELKRIEQIKEEIRECKRIDELKDEFIGTVSHELRTPLISIKNPVDFILKGKTGKINDAQERFLLMAERNIKRLSNIIEYLLNLSKIESGKMELYERFINIKEFIKNIVSEFKSLAQKKKISLDYKLFQEEIDVLIDEDKITQVLINLISNALKFTPQGGWVKIVCMDEGKEVLVCVQDSGIGIAKENIPKLFDKFTQFGRKDGPGAKGTGLGLSICKGIVELHKGRIWVETEVGKGSKFYFSLPRLDVEEIFKEHLSNEVKKAKEEGSHFSVIMFSMMNFKELIQKLPEEAKAIHKELKELANNTLRRKTDKVVKCIDETLVILPYTKREGAIPVLERLKDLLRVFTSKREVLRGKVDLVTGLVSYPEDGKDEEELLNRVRKAKNFS